MIEVATLTKNEKLPIPVYSNIFSSEGEKFISKHDEYLTVLKYINNKFGNMRIYALDRGFKRILQFDLNGIKKIYSRENIKSEQCILPEFSNFNCFIN